MAIMVKLAVDANKFLDKEIFGQAPVVNFMETLGFRYVHEAVSETESGYEYELAGSPLLELRKDNLERIMEIFPYAELSIAEDDEGSVELLLPMSALLDIEVL